MARLPTPSVEAHDLYLMGRQHASWRTVAGLQRSLKYYHDAIALDPDYALAYAGLADSYNMLAGRAGLPRDETFQNALQAALRALAIDDSVAEAHLSLASLKQRYEWDWPVAEYHFRRAVTLNPGWATAHHWYAGFLSNLGRSDEALEAIGRAQELDPLSLPVNTAFGAILYRARRYDEAIAQLERVRRLEPNYQPSYPLLGQVYERKGRFDGAIDAYRTALQLSQEDPGVLAGLAYSFAAAGNSAEARRALDELLRRAEREAVAPSDFALVYKGLKEVDEMFYWLERAYQERDPALMLLKVDPANDGFRQDPRFQDLLRRLGL